MGWKVLEYFIIADDGSLKRIPVSMIERLVHGKATVPELANRTVKAVEVRKSTDENRVPQEIEHVAGFYMKFDEHGHWDKDFELSGTALAFMSIDEVFSTSKSKVVDLGKTKEKRKLEERHRWKPTPAQLRMITEAALGHPRAVPNVKTEKPVRPSPPFSWECKEAYKKIDEHIRPIT
jgi:hypothetical protein